MNIHNFENLDEVNRAKSLVLGLGVNGNISAILDNIGDEFLDKENLDEKD